MIIVECTEFGGNLRRDYRGLLAHRKINVGKGVEDAESTGAILDHAVDAFGDGVGEVCVSTKTMIPESPLLSRTETL